MMNKIIFALMAAAGLISAPAHALNNGDFSSGLTGWSSSGIVTTSNGAAALFSSITNENTAFNTSGLLGTFGATLYQDVTLASGATLAFDWKFTTQDHLPFNDFALLTLGGNQVVLSNVELVGNQGSTGWQHYSTILSAPVSRIAFVVSNQRDNDVSTALYIDNVTAAVPEPETYAMLLAGLGLMAGIARRKQK